MARILWREGRLFIAFALAVYGGSVLMALIYGILHSYEPAQGMTGLAGLAWESIRLATALYLLVFLIFLPFGLVVVVLLRWTRRLALWPCLVAGALSPLVMVFLARFIAHEDPLEGEYLPALAAAFPAGLLGGLILWIVGIRPLAGDTNLTRGI
jgi:hypothetical protein